MKQIIVVAVLLFLGVLSIAGTVHAQPKPSFSLTFDALPYSRFSNPPAGIEDGEIRASAASLTATYPVIFSEGRTVFITELYYQRREFDYLNFPSSDPDIKDIHAGNLTFTVQHGLSQKWSLLAMATPGFATDFEGDFNTDDMNFQTVLAFMRQVSPKFTYGFGAIYSTQFGQPIPLPVLAFNWNNGKNMRWDTILPVSSEFWHAPNKSFEWGLLLKVDGNQYQGDPGIFGVDDPQMRYSVLTFGPSARYRFTDWFNLNVEGGIVGVHRFEFFDGSEEEDSFNLKASGYFRVGVGFGG